jgi:LPXTG-motif cell wall-anchored protein
MSKKIKVLVVAAAATLGLGFGASAFAQMPNLPGMGTTGTGGLTAPAVGSLGDTSHGPCVEQLLDQPALNACRDANGKVIMDLPALQLVGPAAPKKLPATGMNAGDFAAIGAAALAFGAVILRRVRPALAS